MSASNPSGAIAGPPYPPQQQSLGGIPTPRVDVPVSSVYLAFFTIAAALHMGIFQVNRRKHAKLFAFNAAVFGFCCTRIIATVLRIAWAYHQPNVSLGLTTQIFVNAGIPILFITNLFFAQRVTRAQHPKTGWSNLLSIGLPILVVIIIFTILLLIAAIIVESYLPSNEGWARDVQIYGLVLFGVAAFLPIPIVLISIIAKTFPRHRNEAIGKLREGSMSTKVTIVVVAATLLSLGAWFRAGTTLITPVPISQTTPWYFSRACFYIFDFGTEVLVVYIWLLARIDKLYHMPDEAKAPYLSEGASTTKLEALSS